MKRRELVLIVARVLALVAIVGVSIYFVKHTAAQESQTNYENQLTACEQGNPLRKAVALAIGTAAETASKPVNRALYQEALDEQLEQPYINPDGSKRCREAVKHP